MMGIQEAQKDMFNYQVDLDKRVRADNPLRMIETMIDFTFVREKVGRFYGYNGNVSVDPAVVMKMMFLLFYDNVASERELMKIIAERLDYMWFLGYGLDDKIPDHSVLSKARARWGTEVFEEMFMWVVWQCVTKGLVGGEKIHVDASLVDANASKNSVLKGPPEIIGALRELYRKEEKKLAEEEEETPAWGKGLNRGMMSTTDPDAPIVRHGKGDSRPRYKCHRAVDEKKGVITAVETTPGDREENGRLMGLVEQHEGNTGRRVRTVVADVQYGTTENFRACHRRGIRSHMGDLQARQRGTGRQTGIYPEEAFTYDEATDTYRCPAGETLRRRSYNKKRRTYEYAADRKFCRQCHLRDSCTRAKSGRTLKRHEDHEAVVAARAESHSAAAKRDRRKRKWLMEGSFADATVNHGFKRSRWRRLDKQRIQDYLIATVQNIRILLKSTTLTPRLVMAQESALKNALCRISVSCNGGISFLQTVLNRSLLLCKI
jgi:transposase